MLEFIVCSILLPFAIGLIGSYVIVTLGIKLNQRR